MMVKHQAAPSRIQGYCGQGNACCYAAGDHGLDHEAGKTVAWGLETEVDAPLQTGWGFDTSQPAQGLFDFRVYGHCKLPSCSSMAASACRARYSRERMVDSVVSRTRAISTVDSSFTAESNKTSRSLAGRLSMRPRIRA